MIRTARTLVLIMLALAIVAGPAVAQQTTAGSMATSPGASEMKTFTLGDNRFTINTIDQVDATRLQEMGIQTVSVPADTKTYVTYSSSGQLPATASATGIKDVVVFGPNGYVGAMAGTESIMRSAQSYSFTGTSGQYYVVSQLTGGGSVKDMVLVGFG